MATVGIDLGTTNSLVSVWQDDKCTLIPNNLGEYLTPSVVGIDENGEMLVGRTAKERLISHPEKSAWKILGRKMRSQRRVLHSQ